MYMFKFMVAAAILALTTTSHSMEVRVANMECEPANDMAHRMVRYNEDIVLHGDAIVLDSDNNRVDGNMYVMVNPKTKGYTILFEMANEDMVCFLTQGIKMRVFERDDQEDKGTL